MFRPVTTSTTGKTTCGCPSHTYTSTRKRQRVRVSGQTYGAARRTAPAASYAVTSFLNTRLGSPVPAGAERVSRLRHLSACRPIGVSIDRPVRGSPGRARECPPVSPLTDSNRRPRPYHGASGRGRAGTPEASGREDPANRWDQPVRRDPRRRTYALSRIALSRSRSFRFARRIARAIAGAATLEKPEGSPRLRRVILVPPAAVSSHV
jgi:hypothetical protein